MHNFHFISFVCCHRDFQGREFQWGCSVIFREFHSPFPCIWITIPFIGGVLIVLMVILSYDAMLTILSGLNVVFND